MEGKYTLTIEGLEDNGILSHYKVDNSWSLPTHLIWGVAVYVMRELKIHGRCSVVSYTASKMHVNKIDEIFRCSSKYAQDGQWYDWCLIKWVDSSNTSQTYPGLILGFIQVEMNISDFGMKEITYCHQLVVLDPCWHDTLDRGDLSFQQECRLDGGSMNPTCPLPMILELILEYPYP